MKTLIVVLFIASCGAPINDILVDAEPLGASQDASTDDASATSHNADAGVAQPDAASPVDPATWIKIEQPVDNLQFQIRVSKPVVTPLSDGSVVFLWNTSRDDVQSQCGGQGCVGIVEYPAIVPVGCELEGATIIAAAINNTTHVQVRSDGVTRMSEPLPATLLSLPVPVASEGQALAIRYVPEQCANPTNACGFRVFDQAIRYRCPQ